MRILNIATALMLAVSVWVCDAHEPARHARNAPAQPPGVDASLAPVIAVADRFTAAIKAVDLETAAALLDEHVLILESGGAERSRDEYLGHHAVEDAAFLGSAAIKVLHRAGGVQGDLAWLGTESEITPSRTSGGRPILSTETMVLGHGAGGWKILHIHWSSRKKKAE